jgi:hypothetical protein
MLNFDNFKKVDEAKEVKPTEWERKSGFSTMTLEYPPKPNSVTQQFIEFILKKPGSTVKEFYLSINREYVKGNNNQLFAALNQSGLVELVGNKYYIGPNYGKWTQGLLKVVPKVPYWKNRGHNL